MGKVALCRLAQVSAALLHQRGCPKIRGIQAETLAVVNHQVIVGTDSLATSPAHRLSVPLRERYPTRPGKLMLSTNDWFGCRVRCGAMDCRPMLLWDLSGTGSRRTTLNTRTNAATSALPSNCEAI
eukprot:COSAG02_NODE_3122_length_7324_cov_548.027958_2_plen_126_part_00